MHSRSTDLKVAPLRIRMSFAGTAPTPIATAETSAWGEARRGRGRGRGGRIQKSVADESDGRGHRQQGKCTENEIRCAAASAWLGSLHAGQRRRDRPQRGERSASSQVLTRGALSGRSFSPLPRAVPRVMTRCFMLPPVSTPAPSRRDSITACLRGEGERGRTRERREVERAQRWRQCGALRDGEW